MTKLWNAIISIVDIADTPKYNMVVNTVTQEKFAKKNYLWNKETSKIVYKWSKVQIQRKMLLQPWQLKKLQTKVWIWYTQKYDSKHPETTKWEWYKNSRIGEKS